MLLRIGILYLFSCYLIVQYKRAKQNRHKNLTYESDLVVIGIHSSKR